MPLYTQTGQNVSSSRSSTEWKEKQNILLIKPTYEMNRNKSVKHQNMYVIYKEKPNNNIIMHLNGSSTNKQ